jgi:hypothetical protein
MRENGKPEATTPGLREISSLRLESPSKGVPGQIKFIFSYGGSFSGVFFACASPFYVVFFSFRLA